MLYSELEAGVLRYLDQYSVAGEPTPHTYNRQADALGRIPQLINDGIRHIRMAVRPLVAEMRLTDGQDCGSYLRYRLPEEFRSLRGIYSLVGGQLQNVRRYKLLGTRTLLLPKEQGADYTLEYVRTPNTLPREPKADFSLQEEPEVLQAACLYAAALLALQEDEFAYSALMANFERHLGALRPQVHGETDTVSDVYEGG